MSKLFDFITKKVSQKCNEKNAFNNTTEEKRIAIAKIEEEERRRLEQLAKEEFKKRKEEEENRNKKQIEEYLSNSSVFISLNDNDISLKKETRNEEKYVPKVIKPERKKSIYKLPRPYEDFLDPIGDKDGRSVKMIDLINDIPEQLTNKPLLFTLGKDYRNNNVYCDLSEMPHLLIAGTTGSGKSTCLHSIINSLLLRNTPDDVKLVLVDLKRIEFTLYKDIPHLIWPIIDDSKIASSFLKTLVVIIENRYDLLLSVDVRDIVAFNDNVIEHNKKLKDGESSMTKMPYIVVIIDHFSDLMAIAGKDVELSIRRIAELARNVGVHLVVSTSRPSSDVVTGTIKTNLPSRISFALPSEFDSKTILDQGGAEKLLGKGDMLYYPLGVQNPKRVQGTFVSDQEIRRIVKYVKEQARPDYDDSYFEMLGNMYETATISNMSNKADIKDSLYDEVVEFVTSFQKASTSLLQRRFGIGYRRAARLIDTLEEKGVIGPANGMSPREVYLKPKEDK